VCIQELRVVRIRTQPALQLRLMGMFMFGCDEVQERIKQQIQQNTSNEPGTLQQKTTPDTNILQ
jgi:hypothetical protein